MVQRTIGRSPKASNPILKCSISSDAAEYLKAAADAAYGSDTKASIKWFDGKRNTLRHDPNGVEIVIEALRYLLRKGRGRVEKPIRKALGYFRNNRRRMN